MSNKDILYGIGYYSHYLVITYNGVYSAKILIHYVVLLKIIQYFINQLYFNKKITQASEGLQSPTYYFSYAWTVKIVFLISTNIVHACFMFLEISIFLTAYHELESSLHTVLTICFYLYVRLSKYFLVYKHGGQISFVFAPNDCATLLKANRKCFFTYFSLSWIGFITMTILFFFKHDL